MGTHSNPKNIVLHILQPISPILSLAKWSENQGLYKRTSPKLPMKRVTARLPDRIAAQAKRIAERMFGLPRNATSWFICYGIMAATGNIRHMSPEQVRERGAEIRKQIDDMFEEELRGEE